MDLNWYGCVRGTRSLHDEAPEISLVRNLNIGLYSSGTSANNLNLNLLTLLLYSIVTYQSNSSGFYSQSWICLGKLTVAIKTRETRCGYCFVITETT